MKFNKTCGLRTILSTSLLALAVIGLLSQSAKATPYASGLTTNGAGILSFILNESGGTVTVTWDDATTTSLGVLNRGSNGVPIGNHIGWSISVFKAGNGTPVLISSDSFSNSVWGAPRGVGINSNPKNGSIFGRMYLGSSAASGTFGTANFKGLGLYALNADQTDAIGKGTNATATGTFAAGGGFAPWRIRVAPDGTALVTDFGTPGATVWQFQPDLSSSNLVLAGIGQTANPSVHGDPFGAAIMTGSLAEGNLKLYLGDGRTPAPATATKGAAYDHGNASPAYQTSTGDANCIMRFDIGAGPLPWNSPPNYAYTMGLPGIAGLRTEIDVGPDGKLICGFGRANNSNPNIQILDPQGTNVLYTSWDSTGGVSDPWAGSRGSTSTVGTYAGVRASRDGRYFASVDLNNGVTIANMVNGLPDDSTIFGIINTSATANSRGMDWDAADNIWVSSSGQGLLRCYSLGVTATAITTNDYTGTNGNFTLITPDVVAGINTTTPLASQHYTNNPAGPGKGFGTPGVFTIALNTNNLTQAVQVTFINSGTATGPWVAGVGTTNNWYYPDIGTDADGITLTTNTVTFPAGAYPHAGNWRKDIRIQPTTYPISGPTFTVGMRLQGGTNYAAGSPVSGTVNIQNTGPQLLFITAAASGTTMNRAVTNDYARFLVTRWGDTNGPANDAVTVNQLSYTVTNVNYGGTALYPLDYTARAQRTDPAGNGVAVIPTDGTPGIVINPGDLTVTAVVGNPVFHPNVFQTPTNVTIIPNLTNSVSSPSTNANTLEGYAYSVTTANTTLTEIDNCVLPEAVVLWSNPLTNATDSTNWTVTVASTAFNLNTFVPVLPFVAPNYNNDLLGGNNPTNAFVQFGRDITLDSIPPSPVMAAQGWTTALRMSVNKSAGYKSGVNVYPQLTNTFKGNYALRFSMFLSPWASAINNPGPGTFPREFAAFGINHQGTNCNWRLDVNPLAAGTGSAPTNSDGVWFAIDAASGSTTPADYDAFTPGKVPNSGVGADLTSNGANSQNGVFKNPPFPKIGAGGSPISQWVEVSVEVTRQTNVTLLLDRAAVLAAFSITNGGYYSNGVPMLGYLDPVADISDDSAYVYYSNLRVVKLSPYIITNLPFGIIVTQGWPSISLTSACYMADGPITNQWFKGPTFTTANPPAFTGGPNGNPLTNAADGQTTYTTAPGTTNMTGTFTITNFLAGTNIYAVFSDTAGSVFSTPYLVEVVGGPGNKATNAGANVSFTVTPTGPSAPTAFNWRTNGVNLVTNAHFNGVKAATLTITNVQAADAAVLYSCESVSAVGNTTNYATLVVSNAPSSITVSPAAQTNLWGSTASFTVSAAGSAPLTYLWQTNLIRLTNSTHYAGVATSTLNISNVTGADAKSYTAGVTNSVGGGISSVGTLSVAVPSPVLSNVVVSGSSVTLTFGSPNNPYDTTNAFVLQSCGIVNGTYTNVPGGTYTVSGSTFQVTVPQPADANMFYRLQHVQ